VVYYFYLDLYIYFGFPLARLKWRILLKSVRLPLHHPYIDDVPIKGPMTMYQKVDDSYETIPENPGIRRFVWEHFENLNRVVQSRKYCGGTVRGHRW
jgi:hypothetical protein